jgi:metal-responsive CopG/Arc/MetJ family transcriptional regulator
MKTAISLPDTLFEQAEQLAQRFDLNRSQLYARALQEYLDKYNSDSITATFNSIYATESSEIDPALWQMQLLSLPEDEW